MHCVSWFEKKEKLHVCRDDGIMRDSSGSFCGKLRTNIFDLMEPYWKCFFGLTSIIPFILFLGCPYHPCYFSGQGWHISPKGDSLLN